MSPRTTTGTSITGHGIWHPETILDNPELCVAFNEFVRRQNAKHADEIAAGKREPLKESSPEFIIKASGIIHRYVEDKTGLLDPDRMCPNIKDRPEDQLSIQAEYAVNAGKRALERAGKTGEDVDLVVLGCSNLQRLYPAIAIEVQDAIGAHGYGFDISLGCSAATGATQLASQAVRLGQAKCALVVVPELTTGHMNWKERDSHFIFGDAAVALVIEPTANAKPGSWEIISTQMASKWSNTIRNNRGYLDRCDPDTENDETSKLFHQQGRRVFKDVVPMAEKFIKDHLAAHDLTPQQTARFWLHQANGPMNALIAKRLLGRESTREEAPIILDEFGNTASAGSLIAFSRHNEDLPAGSYGMMASFGAGYSLGSLLLQRQ
ncbi:MAG: beta-ketoacyl-ACP synthase III [Deltaproteobacteria bacterium]|nr:beta-ketoacyl-ACP synthase III [Deltaproteobacteria bacterium]MDQ3298347.1 beta-ketoacyl-ACP synthase III [Myxococcota bacterium]